MSRSDRTHRTPRSPRQRRTRGAAESLGSIVLVFETIVVFLAGLAVYGLQALPAGIAPWWGIVAGTVLAIVALLTAAVLRHRPAVVVGWALQIVLLLGGLLVPGIAIVGVLFGAMWAYAIVKGTALDRRNARLAQEAAGREAGAE